MIEIELNPRRAVATDRARADAEHDMSPVEAYNSAIRRAVAAGRYVEAENIARRLAAELPGEADGMFQLAMDLCRHGAVDRGLRAFAAALAIAPGQARIHARLAATLANQGDFRRAAAAAGLAVDLGLEEWFDFFNTGSILFHAGRAELAIHALQAAARLKPESTDTLRLLGDAHARRKRFREALDVFARLCHLAPEDWTAHLNLAVALRQTGQRVQSIAPLARVVQLKPERADLQHAVAMALIRLDRAAEAAPFYVKAAHGQVEVLSRKVAFYSLRSIFDALWDGQGTEAAYGTAIVLLEQVGSAVWAGCLGSRRADTWTFLAEIRDRSPRSPFDAGIDHLLAHRPADALRTYADHLKAGTLLPDKYAAVLGRGCDLAHPAWHLMNPYFYLWADGDMQQETAAQDAWRAPDVFDAGRPRSQLLEEYDAWRATPAPSRAELKRCIAELSPPAGSVIDIGCGIGHVLRLLATDCRIPVAKVFGCDLHPRRVEAARHFLTVAAEEQGFSSSDAAALAARNVFVCDALNWDVDEFVARHGAIDLVTLFVITGCFDDGQLDAFLARVARLGARRIFETSVVDRWELWVGRKDASAHFLKHGYRCVHRLLPGEAMAGNERYLVLPRKYWPGHQISVYDRV